MPKRKLCQCLHYIEKLRWLTLQWHRYTWNKTTWNGLNGSHFVIPESMSPKRLTTKPMRGLLQGEHFTVALNLLQWRLIAQRNILRSIKNFHSFDAWNVRKPSDMFHVVRANNARIKRKKIPSPSSLDLKMLALQVGHSATKVLSFLGIGDMLTHSCFTTSRVYWENKKKFQR